MFGDQFKKSIQSGLETSTMSASRFVGRIGGLAVALGIGTAVMVSPAQAWADATGSAGTSPRDGSAASQRSAEPADRKLNPTSLRPAPRKPSLGARSSDSTAIADSLSASPRTFNSQTKIAGRGVSDNVPRPVATSVAAPLGGGDSPSVTAVSELGDFPAQRIISSPVSAVMTSAPPSASSSSGTAAPMHVPVMTAVAAPVSGGAPEGAAALQVVGAQVPDGAPVSWVMTAAALGQLGSSRSATGLTAGTASAVAVAAGPPRRQSALKPRQVPPLLQYFKAFGVKAPVLLRAKFAVSDLKAAGYVATELKGAGVALSALVAAKYTATELKDARFGAADLKGAGFGAADL